MKYYEILTILIVICAVFAYINARFIKLPPAIGIMILSLLSSLAIIIIGRTDSGFSAFAVNMIKVIDFRTLLMQSMLGFLLFAGSVHIDTGMLKKERTQVATLAVFSTLLSTAIVAGLLYLVFYIAGFHIAFIYCLLFGALISPTDPIAVLSVLKTAGIPRSLEMKIAGESLFNDGIGVVIFVTILEVAQTGISKLSGLDIILLFIREAGGGILYGVILGYVGLMLLRRINSYQVEVLITVAIVMGGYQLANMLHISGPLAMVMAGLIIGSKSKGAVMSANSRDYLNKFWELVDEILNALLFMLMGFEMLVIPATEGLALVSVATVFIVLIARWISVAVPMVAFRFRNSFEKRAITILSWGGLKGGLSIAMALSLPQEMYKDQFVAMTYTVVVFSIIVQGLSIGKIARRFNP